MKQIQDRGDCGDKLRNVHIVEGVTCTDNNYFVRQGRFEIMQRINQETDHLK